MLYTDRAGDDYTHPRRPTASLIYPPTGIPHAEDSPLVIPHRNIEGAEG